MSPATIVHFQEGNASAYLFRQYMWNAGSRRFHQHEMQSRVIGSAKLS